MYRDGDGRSRSGPWSAEETVIALDAATGNTAWEYSYPSTLEDFSFGSGPHATPLVVGNRLFAAGTNKQLHAFDTRTGRLLWSHDLVADFDAPPLLIRPRVKAGYGCSPLAYRDLVICQVGGPGQSVMAFRQEDGSVAWRSGDFLVSQAPLLLIDVGDQTQLVVFAGQAVHGLDPSTGRIYWSQPHDAGNDFNFMVPLWGPDNVMFVSSGYIAGSQAFRLTRDGDHTLVTPLWFNERVKFMFLNPIRLGGYVYGTDGTFGPAFLTAVDLRTGQAVWRERGFARGSLLYADGKGILLDEDGDLALMALTQDGARTLARTTIFYTTAWTAPTLVGTTLYARDREQIMAIDLGRR